MVILVVGVFSFLYSDMTLNVKYIYDDIKHIQDLNFNAQRFISLTLANNKVDDDALASIRNDMDTYLTMYKDESLFVLQNDEFRKIVQEVVLYWEIVEIELENIYNSPNATEDNYINLLLARESYNKNINNLLVASVNYSKQLNGKIILYQYLVLGILFPQFMLIAYKNASLNKRLRANQDLIENMGVEHYVIDDDDEVDDAPKKKFSFKKRAKADILDINEYRGRYFVMPSPLFRKGREDAVLDLTKDIEENKSYKQEISRKKSRPNSSNFSTVLLVIVFVVLLFLIHFVYA